LDARPQRLCCIPVKPTKKIFFCQGVLEFFLLFFEGPDYDILRGICHLLPFWLLRGIIRGMGGNGKKTDIIENGGKVLVNLGQLMFGTLFLGGVLRGEMPKYIMMLAGVAGAILFIMIGLFISAKERKTTEE
jgi:hypothetical protein